MLDYNFTVMHQEHLHDMEHEIAVERLYRRARTGQQRWIALSTWVLRIGLMPVAMRSCYAIARRWVRGALSDAAELRGHKIMQLQVHS